MLPFNLGDALEVVSALPGESVDLIFADPPYNLSNGGCTCYKGRRVSVNKENWDRSRKVQADFNFCQIWLVAYHTRLQPSKEQRVGAGRKVFRYQGRDCFFIAPGKEPCRIVQCEWSRIYDGTDVARLGSTLRHKETYSSENKSPALTASLAASTPRNVVEEPMEDTV